MTKKEYMREANRKYDASAHGKAARKAYRAKKNSECFIYHSSKLVACMRQNDKKKGRVTDGYSALIPIMLKPCSYCGEFYYDIEGVKYNSLDRLDNNIGHTVSNVVPSCKRCNVARNDRSIEEFKLHVLKMYEHMFKN